MTLLTEIFEITFYCSITDKPFSVQFGRHNDHELFVISDIRKIIPLSDNSEQHYQSMPSEIPSNNLSITGFKCPHCAHDGSNNIPVYLRCGTCHDYVCGGNTGKIFFHCRPSCGSRSLMARTRNIETYVGSMEKITKQLVNIEPKAKNRTQLKISQITKQISILITRED